MKRIKRILQALLALAIIVTIGGTIFVRHISRKALPDYNSNIVLKDLNANVEVIRDKYAIPHIYAENQHDLYIATGYIMAQERLWQMDLLRRVTLGRLSEIFGRKYINSDVLLRALRFSEKSARILANSDTLLIEALEAFSDGVNQYIQSHTKKLPPEFSILGYQPDPWETVHSLNLIGYMAWDLKAGWNELILEDIRKVVDSAYFAELIPDISIYKSFVYPEFRSLPNPGTFMQDMAALSENLEGFGVDVFSASNNWAVSGKKSVTGKPLLANDMHLDLNVPGIWFQLHQVIKGQLDVTSLALPGQPLVICGHNNSIAWGMTNTYVDNMDFYLEKINPADSNQYEYLGEWREFENRKEVIRTKEGATIERTIRFNQRGPVISGFKDIKDKVVTMHWAGDEPSDEMRTVYLLNRAANWEDFKNALTTFQSISQNVVYADTAGNIGLFCAAGIPIRKRDIAYGFLPGWTDEYNWQCMVPFDELPFSYNPECGYVASANNKTVDSTYPYHISLWYSLPYRIDRIRELLNEKDKLSIDDFKAIQLDQKSKLSDQLMPLILGSLKNENLSPTEISCRDLLGKWNRAMGTESPEATIFEAFYINLLKNIFMDELGNSLYERFIKTSKIGKTALYRAVERNESVWVDNIVTPQKEDLENIIVQSFKETIMVLTEDYGSDPSTWKWGNYHQLTLTHPLSSVKVLNSLFKLNSGPYKVGGSHHTVSPFGYSFLNPYLANHGASHRHTFSLGEWDESLTVIPTGNSGIPASKNYCDQTSLYINGQYHKDWYSKDEVEQNAVNRMKFVAK